MTSLIIFGDPQPLPPLPEKNLGDDGHRLSRLVSVIYPVDGRERGSKSHLDTPEVKSDLGPIPTLTEQEVESRKVGPGPRTRNVVGVSLFPHLLCRPVSNRSGVGDFTPVRTHKQTIPTILFHDVCPTEVVVYKEESGKISGLPGTRETSKTPSQTRSGDREDPRDRTFTGRRRTQRSVTLRRHRFKDENDSCGSI